MESVTEPVNPPVGDAVTVNVLLLPAFIDAEPGLAVRLKSAAAKTGTLRRSAPSIMSPMR